MASNPSMDSFLTSILHRLHGMQMRCSSTLTWTKAPAIVCSTNSMTTLTTPATTVKMAVSRAVSEARIVIDVMTLNALYVLALVKMLFVVCVDFRRCPRELVLLVNA